MNTLLVSSEFEGEIGGHEFDASSVNAAGLTELFSSITFFLQFLPKTVTYMLFYLLYYGFLAVVTYAP